MIAILRSLCQRTTRAVCSWCDHAARYGASPAAPLRGQRCQKCGEFGTLVAQDAKGDAP